MELKASRIHEKGSRLLRIAHLRMTPNIRSQRSKTDSNMKKNTNTFPQSSFGWEIYLNCLVWWHLNPKNFPCCWFVIHPILKPPRHPFFQGEKRPGTDFSGQDFGFRRWFRHAKGCLIGRVWEEDQLHKVCGEKNADFLLGGLELKNDSMILLPPNAAKKILQRLNHQPVPCLRIDCTGGRSRRESLQEVFVFYRWTVSEKCLYLCHSSYITYHYTNTYIWYLWGDWQCPMYMAYIYSQMCTISL